MDTETEVEFNSFHGVVVRAMWRALTILGLCSGCLSLLAASPPLTLRNKVDTSDSILMFSLTQVKPPEGTTNSFGSGEAKVLEVLKGPPDLKELNFCYSVSGRFAAGATNVVSGRDYIGFFRWVGDKYWAIQGASGLRAVSTQYQEVRMDGKGRYILDTFSHTDYLNAVRKLAAVPKVSISELLKNQQRYFGKRVEVTGYYVSSFEHSGLYETKEDSHRFRENPKPFGAIHNGLWIMPFAKPGYEGKMRPVKEGMVRIIGTFSYNQDQELGVGHLNGWPAELSALEVFEPLP